MENGVDVGGSRVSLRDQKGMGATAEQVDWAWSM